MFHIHLKEMKILVVDDEPTYRMLLEDFLKGQGWTVFTAAEGEEGLAILRSAKINFIISDVYMPTMDGLKFLKAVREIPGCQTTPFLFMSSNDDEHTKEAVQASKNGAFMKKSRPMNELKAWIAYLLMPKENRPTTPPGSESAPLSTRTPRREDRSAGR